MSIEHDNVELSRRAAILAQRAFVELLSRDPTTVSGSLEAAAQFVTNSCAQLLGSERAGVWLFDDARAELRCVDRFSLSSGDHSSEGILREEEYRPEFQTLKSALYVDASFPLTDPRTAGYVEGYLKPNGITSMLDAVIRFGGESLGTLCLEHVDKRHVWMQDEIDFACLVGSQLSVLLERLARRETQERLEAALKLERRRAEWTSVVAHDLRQPVSAISLRAQLLARSEDATVLGHADRIRADARRLTRMIDDLMDVSRLDAERLELVLQRVDVPVLVRAAVEPFAVAAPDRPFEVHVVGDVPPAWADPDRVTQVVANLLANALKYGRPRSAVVVTIEPDGRELGVSVASSGRPLASDEIERIFERFRRGDAAKLEGIEGVGLGLYITRALVQAHGGHVSVVSTPEGVNTFRFTLPTTATS
ncbi:MAG TPA: GAF domain-containing sensor histidine kinase [Polyangiaceae bacterium]|nr:GAF domain-containing sensor histidine kinase [Polyangiaceae bacterium]